jgi:hypothetical protein
MSRIINIDDSLAERGDLNFQYPSFDRVQTGGKEQGPNSIESGSSRILSYFLLLAFRARAAEP